MVSIEIRNEAVAMRILPECGGKMESLRSLASGREWLWRNPYLSLRHPVYGESYVKNLDFGGWDEILPSVSPCTFAAKDGRTVVVPDHGDLACLPWRLDQHLADAVQLSCSGRSWPFHFERRIGLSEHGFTASYRLVNQHPREAFPWLWCAHPLIAIEPGMVVRWIGADGAEMGSVLVPDPAAPGFKPSSEKRFVLGAVAASVSSPDGKEQLVFSFLPEEVPVLAFWINFLAWTGANTPPLFNLGVEPATAACNGLDKAISTGLARSLEPGAAASWTLQVQLRRR